MIADQAIIALRRDEMNKIKFGIRFTVNKYSWNRLMTFVDCTEGGDRMVHTPELAKRYIKFCLQLSNKEIKPSTLVDADVMQLFSDDLDNIANIDLNEQEVDEALQGGRMLLGRYQKIKAVHGIGRY
jgi:hypothetical protein|tara:strand:+ start:139 stop:519 length:381 start_codon:yes stop_codon:yes gene_type:complete